MEPVIFSIIFAVSAVSGVLCLMLSFFTWAASGMATGPRTIQDRVIWLSLLAGVGFFGWAFWALGEI
jgi:hypothetical protein